LQVYGTTSKDPKAADNTTGTKIWPIEVHKAPIRGEPKITHAGKGEGEKPGEDWTGSRRKGTTGTQPGTYGPVVEWS